MKSQKQMHDHEPSSLIPLHDGMVLSFINYEIRVNLEKKDASEVQADNDAVNERRAQQAASSPAQPAMASTMAAAAAVHVEEPAAQEEEAEVEVKPEQSIHADEEVEDAIEDA